jgi:hypothetical protein
MRTKDMQQLADANEDKLIGVFNPTTKNFTWKYDGESYTIPKGEMVKFKYHLAHHMAKHLIDKILTDKSTPTNKVEERAKWEKKILI